MVEGLKLLHVQYVRYYKVWDITKSEALLKCLSLCGYFYATIDQFMSLVAAVSNNNCMSSSGEICILFHGLLMIKSSFVGSLHGRRAVWMLMNWLPKICFNSALKLRTLGGGKVFPLVWAVQRPCKGAAVASSLTYCSTNELLWQVH